MPNPLYQTSDLTAVAIEQVLARDWEFQVTSANPILACIKDAELGWKKGYTVQGLAALVPLVFTDISTFTSGNAGIADSAQIPAAWPTFDATEGFTQARYEYTHFERSMTVLETERVLAANGARGNLIDGKTKQLAAKFASITADQLSGAANCSRTSLMGMDYMIAANNTMGGIDRAPAGGAYWRSTVDATGGALSFPVINNAYDGITRHANELGETGKPDLLLLTYVGAGVNLYSKMRELIAPSERFFHEDFKVKYGIDHFTYMGLKCVMETRGAGGQAKMLTTSKMVFGGYDKPKQLETIRIPGSSAEERRFVWWGFVGTTQGRMHWRGTGFTG